jgi:ApbE superfamily uncharacterized protein (UPF0280 family)
VVYEPRVYRSLHREEDLHHFQVILGETDLDIGVKKEQYHTALKQKVEIFITEQRKVLKEYIASHPDFATTLEPWKPTEDAPGLIREMCKAAALAGVGPMAAVAGLLAEKTGFYLVHFSRDVIIENGGDIWLKTSRIRKVSIYAGNSPFSQQIGLEIKPGKTPMGICTSSGTVGYSLSFGRADAVVILATSAVLADAVATAACNMVQNSNDLEKAVNWAMAVVGVQGAVAIIGDKMAAQGDVKLIPL